jgi:hypothetical protein
MLIPVPHTPRVYPFIVTDLVTYLCVGIRLLLSLGGSGLTVQSFARHLDVADLAVIAPSANDFVWLLR